MNFRLLYLSFKQMRYYALVPVLIIFVLMPLISVATVVMTGDLRSAFFYISREIERFIPLFSTFWTMLMMKEYIDVEGSEIFYTKTYGGKSKLGLILSFFFVYILQVVVLYLGFSLYFEGMLLECLKTIIQCFFMTGLFYLGIYTLKSTLIVFIGNLILVIILTFIPLGQLETFNVFLKGELMSTSLLLSKFSVLIVSNIILWIVGIYLNYKTEVVTQ